MLALSINKSDVLQSAQVQSSRKPHHGTSSGLLPLSQTSIPHYMSWTVPRVKQVGKSHELCLLSTAFKLPKFHQTPTGSLRTPVWKWTETTECPWEVPLFALFCSILTINFWHLGLKAHCCSFPQRLTPSDKRCLWTERPRRYGVTWTLV